MKIMRQNIWLNLLLISTVILLEICAKDTRSNLPLQNVTNPGISTGSAADILPHFLEILPSLNARDTGAGQDVHEFGQLSTPPFDKVVEKMEQHRERTQRRIRNRICFFCLFLTDHLEFFQFYDMNALRRMNIIASHCKDTIIRYIHHQDGKPPYQCFAFHTQL